MTESRPEDGLRHAAAAAPGGGITDAEFVEVKAPSRFGRSYLLTCFTLGLIAVQSVGIMVVPSSEAAQVFVIAIPIEGGLAAAWTGIANWAEVRKS